MDYLVFAHLQKGEDDKALAAIEEMPEAPEGTPLSFAGVYAHAVIPARYAVERRQWREAAKLPEPTALPGGRYAWANAAVHFVRALGAARSGDPEQARAQVAKLEECRETLQQHREDYWATQVDIQRLSATAWLALAEGRHAEAVDSMQAAVELEETTDKHPVTPGQIVAARDLLGQMLVELERPEEALAQFEAVLKAEPNRFGPLFGAARAAELAGRAGIARERFARLVELAGESKRPEIGTAMDYLELSRMTRTSIN